MRIRYLPNYITVFRIISTIILIFMETFSTEFFTVYILAGLSDVVDGWIARRTNNTSETGAKLDSIADLMFYIVMVLKIMPILISRLPMYVWYMLGTVLVLRVISYGIAFVKYRQFASLHTYMNKVTGGVVFLVPFMIQTRIGAGFCMAGCTIAIIAVVEEIMIHSWNKKYNSSIKSIVMLDRSKKRTIER